MENKRRSRSKKGGNRLFQYFGKEEHKKVLSDELTVFALVAALFLLLCAGSRAFMQ